MARIVGSSARIRSALIDALSHSRWAECNCRGLGSAGLPAIELQGRRPTCGMVQGVPFHHGQGRESFRACGTGREFRGMLRPIALFVGLVVAAAGCGDAPRETSPVTAESEKETAAEMAEADGTDEKFGDEPAGIETPEPAEEVAAEEMPSEEVSAAEPAESAESSLLELEGIRFVVPGAWNKVKPQNNIVEAEFELPHLPGDEFDGRLTLMSSGGGSHTTPTSHNQLLHKNLHTIQISF